MRDDLAGAEKWCCLCWLLQHCLSTMDTHLLMLLTELVPNLVCPCSLRSCTYSIKSSKAMKYWGKKWWGSGDPQRPGSIRWGCHTDKAYSCTGSNAAPSVGHHIGTGRTHSSAGLNLHASHSSLTRLLNPPHFCPCLCMNDFCKNLTHL